jgi:hypothetical protein
MQGETIISAGEERYYHARCLKCNKCQAQLDPSGNVYSQGGIFYCQKDYALLYGPKCVECKQVIEGGTSLSVEVGTGEKLTFHPACLCCSFCKTKLSGGAYYLKDDRIACEGCA